mmetsp:Transcript_57210/g.134138  ORF Transcript_57210/g.134138 Transcript_57210/m.134138 type:complete len:652 (+) Transcript_57210:220-2175(+)
MVHRRQVRMRHGSEAGRRDLEVPIRARRKLQEGALVASGVQVIRRAEHTHQRWMVLKVALRLDLVRADHELKVVLPNKLIRHVGAEHEDTAAFAVGRTIARAASRVRPQEVDDHAGVRLPLLFLPRGLIDCILVGIGGQLRVTVYRGDLRQGARLEVHRHGVLWVVGLAGQPDTWPGARDAGMDNQDLVVHEVKQGKVSEGLGVEVEEVQIVLATHLTGEAVDHVGLQHLVVSAVHEDGIRVLHLHGKDHGDDLHGPGSSVNEVPIEEERRIDRRHAGHAQHVHEVEILAVDVPEHREFLARIHLDSAQGLLALELSDHIQHKQISVLLGKELSLLLALQEPLEPPIVDIACLRVTWSVVARGRFGHSHGPLAFLRQVLVGPATETRRPSTSRNGRCCCCRLLHGRHLYVLDGDREVNRLMLTSSLRPALEGRGGLDIRIWDKILKEVHDVFEVPAAHILAIHSLDDIAFLHPCHGCLTQRVAWISGLLVHVHNHGPLAVKAVRISLDATGPLFQLDGVRRSDAGIICSVEVWILLHPAVSVCAIARAQRALSLTDDATAPHVLGFAVPCSRNRSDAQANRDSWRSTGTGSRAKGRGGLGRRRHGLARCRLSWQQEAGSQCSSCSQTQHGTRPACSRHTWLVREGRQYLNT